MPEQGKGQTMPTGDLHGGTMEIKDRQGNPVNFEVVRIGTTKELVTVKAALEERGRILDSVSAQRNGFEAKAKATVAKLDTADAAYKAEKLANEAFRVTTKELREELAEEKRMRVDSDEERGTLLGSLESARAEFSKACEHREETMSRLNAANEEYRELHALFAAKDAEIDTLMSTKAALEETQTALEVKDKELCEAREAKADAVKAYVGYRDSNAAMTTSLRATERERDKSNAALADLKAELLKDAGCMSVVLDALHEKLTGE